MLYEVLLSTVIKAPPRMPRPPKLRSSCDGCGAAKIKCDRAQPQCERCLSLDLVCVYGVSRKTGKPPRERLRIPEAPGTFRTLGGHAHAGSHDRDGRNDRCRSATGGFGYGDIVRDSGQVLGVNNVLPARSAVDGHPESFRTSVNALDAMHSDLFGPLLPDFTSLEFGDGLFSNMETGPISSLATPESESYSTPATQPDASQTHVDESRYLDNALLPSVSCKGHDCFREAYDILGSLSFHSLNDAHSISESPPPGSASTTASTTNRVPLDHVLRVNREASERLSHLLTCSCAGFQQLTMLYASIISQVLIRYQQAAGCTQGASWSPAAMELDTASHHVSLTGSSPSSGSGSWGGSSTWSSTAASTFSTGGAKSTRPLRQFTGLAVVPAKMAIGTFNVDDLRVQTALKIQLLSGEIRRAGRLIDQFTSHNSGQCLHDEHNFGGVNSLYQSLDSWLRGEHSGIDNMMRSKLRELNS